MSTAIFSVVVPTVGRAALARAVRSLQDQLRPGDEVIIVRDLGSGDWGAAARMDAIRRARGSHLLFMDDDDEFLPGAFDAFRSFAEETPDRVGIFRMRYQFHPSYPRRHVLWETPELREGNVSTQMFCVPNLPDKLGVWNPERAAGDLDFILGTCALQGDPIFREEVVAVIRPAWGLAVGWAARRFKARLKAQSSVTR